MAPKDVPLLVRCSFWGALRALLQVSTWSEWFSWPQELVSPGFVWGVVGVVFVPQIEAANKSELF